MFSSSPYSVPMSGFNLYQHPFPSINRLQDYCSNKLNNNHHQFQQNPGPSYQDYNTPTTFMDTRSYNNGLFSTPSEQNTSNFTKIDYSNKSYDSSYKNINDNLNEPGWITSSEYKNIRDRLQLNLFNGNVQISQLYPNSEMFSILMYLENEWKKNCSRKDIKVLVPASFKESVSTMLNHNQKNNESRKIQQKSDLVKANNLSKHKSFKSKPQIKRPLSSFFMFFKEHRHHITNLFPKGTKAEVITKRAGELWRKLDTNEKKRYITMASEAREKWCNDMKVGRSLSNFERIKNYD